MSLKEIANQTIPAATNKTVLKYSNGNTDDIVQEVLACYRDSRTQLVKFAPHLRGKDTLETCRNIWNFWKENIQYKIDATGGQWVQTPAAVWSKKVCDCKSFSVAIAASLYALGIDGKFRFTSYGSNTTAPTHVYVVAMVDGKEIIIDCVWTAFNSQKAFKKNWDYNMSNIFRVSGLGAISNKGVLDIDVNDHDTTEAEMDLALNKQRLEMEQMISRRQHSIGSITDNAYQTEIEAHNAALGAIGKAKKGKTAAKVVSIKKAPAKKAPNKRVAKKTAAAVKANAGKGVTKKQSKLLTKAGVTIQKRKTTLLKKVAKGITKVVSTPIRLAAKTQLPRQAPFFLYLFLTDQKVIDKLPSVVLQKRAAALKYKKVLVDKLQMKESNFTSIVRNGIMNAFGKSPENVLAEWTANFRKENGIGILPLAALAAAGPGLKALVNKLAGGVADDIENNSPAPEDWGTVSPEVVNDLQTDIKEQPSNNDPATNNGSVRPTNDSGDYTVKTPTGGGANRTYDGAVEPLSDEEYENMDSKYSDPADNPTGEGKLTQTQTLEEVIIAPVRKSADSGSGTGLLLVGLAVVAVVASSSSSSKKKN